MRTGEVVDESIYPMAPHMKTEEARLQTFSSWPSNAPVRPRDLAQAGFYYLMEDDRVQCFCCGGMLGGWEQGDTAWEEHSKHYPICFFILGHDVGNIPLLRGTEEEERGSRQHTNRRVPMESFEERLNSFAVVQHPVDPEKLARAGFYSKGTTIGETRICAWLDFMRYLITAMIAGLFKLFVCTCRDSGSGVVFQLWWRFERLAA